MKVKVSQSCLTLCDPTDYAVHGILQTRILEWVAFPFSRGSSQLRDWTQDSHTAGGFFTSWAQAMTNLDSILKNWDITLPMGFPCCSAGKESACNTGDLGLIPGLGRSPVEGKGYPLQYSGLENSMDCIAHRVAKSQTWLSNFHSPVYYKRTW